jgi:hypothetical protein
MVALNFNAANVKPKDEIEVLPPGDYTVMIVASEMRETKDGTGQYLWLEMDVTEGEAQGRKLWDRLNLINKNAKAAEIAERTLSSICHAVGKLNVADSEELHGCTLVAKVKVRPGQGDYGPSNEVANYRAAAGGQVVQMQRAAQPAQQAPVQQAAPARAAAPAKAAGATPPWRR